MEDYKICEECGGKMLPATIDWESHSNGKTIALKGLNAYKCEDCNEVVFEKEEVKIIERLAHAFNTNIVHTFMGKVQSEQAKQALQLADELSDMILFHKRVRENGSAMMVAWEDD